MAYTFPHDENARQDPKLIRLVRVKGWKGYGIYWMVVEIMHEQGGSIDDENIADIAYQTNEDEANIRDILKNFNLFNYDEKTYTCDRVHANLALRSKNKKRSQEALKHRWPEKNGVENQVVNTTSILHASVKDSYTHQSSNANNIREDNIREDNIREDNIGGKSRFEKPTIEEIEEYLVSQNIANPKVQADKFWNAYEAKGWMIGKNKMKSWKSAVKTWQMPKKQSSSGIPHISELK